MKSKLVILMCALASIIIVFNEDKPSHNQYCSDACGYYLYLPAIFIYHNLAKLDFYPALDSAYHFSFGLNYSLYNVDGKKLDKYHIGVSFFELPLFLIAHAYCRLTHGYPADGFTLPYQLAGIFSNILWLILGLCVLRHFLKQHYPDTIVSLTLLCIAFGTNLYAYTAFNAGMSHPYSFFLFSCLMALTDKWHAKPQQKYTGILLGLSLGFIFIVRPINIIAMLIPVLWQVHSWTSLKKRMVFFRVHYKSVTTILLFFIGVAFIQFAYWKYITGHWLFYAYPGEGFSFLHPNIINGLFSYRKGWFVYTPMALAGLAGFYFLSKRKRELIPVLFLFFLLMIYCVFSWQQWWYGGSFGCRPLMETFAIMAILLAAEIEYFYYAVNKIKKTIYFAVITLIIGLNLFQTYQYSMGVIHWSRMTKDYYWKVFGKVDIDRVQDEKYLMSKEQEHMIDK